MEETIGKAVEYHREFRTAIFASSLTLGTFLFTMKTFIVSTMKTDVYDSADYQEQVRQRRAGKMGGGYYTPLRNFTILITAAIGWAFVNALLQITLGYSGRVCAVWICFASTLVSWLLVAGVLYLVSRNLLSMIDRAEVETRKRLDRVT